MTETQPIAPTPRPAATLVLLRDSPAGVQVLLTTRPKRMSFMGGAAVFPGGSIADADRDQAWSEMSVRSGHDAAAALGEPDGSDALGWFVCALRESFEEVGLLLADGPVEELARDDAEDAGCFMRRCRTLGLSLRTDLLVPAGRWVTPLGAPVRFDARFFVTVAPPDWTPTPDPREVERCWWTTPAEALASLGAGDLLMAPPTIEMLQRLEGGRTVEEVRWGLEEAPVGTRGDLISVRLSPLVHVVLAPNPGVMTGPGTNTYIVGQGSVCVIDPAVEDPGYLEEVCSVAGDISSILITHRHSDHVGGAAALSASVGCPVRAFGDEPAGRAPVVPLVDGEVIDAGNASLRALHTPGHALDHLCFYLEGAASLFAGDNVLGEGTAVIAPPDGNMRDYLASLRRLRELHIDRIYPGHFRPLDGGAAVIDGYLAHRARRRAAVLDAVSAEARSVEDIVAVVYRDTPAHLHPVAAYQVLAMLEMLEEDGEVTASGGNWRIAAVD